MTEPRGMTSRRVRIRVTLLIDADTAEYAAEYGTRATITAVRDYIEMTVAEATREALRLTLPSAAESVRVAER